VVGDVVVVVGAGDVEVVSGVVEVVSVSVDVGAPVVVEVAASSPVHDATATAMASNVAIGRRLG
jgi:hypothetical protein